MFIDNNIGLFITDNIKMNPFYSIHLSQKMVSNIKKDNKKYALFIDDDPREPAWTTISYFLEHRFEISKKTFKQITYNDYYKKINFEHKESIINEWNNSIFVEYYYPSVDNNINNWLSIYFIFINVDGEDKLVGLSRNYQ